MVEDRNVAGAVSGKRQHRIRTRGHCDETGLVASGGVAGPGQCFDTEYVGVVVDGPVSAVETHDSELGEPISVDYWSAEYALSAVSQIIGERGAATEYEVQECQAGRRD